jgi:hypothetical protein
VLPEPAAEHADTLLSVPRIRDLVAFVPAAVGGPTVRRGK